MRPSLAERSGIPTEMSEELLRMNAEIKEGKLSKRKKVSCPYLRCFLSR